jgi:hypothetical protein
MLFLRFGGLTRLRIGRFPASFIFRIVRAASRGRQRAARMARRLAAARTGSECGDGGPARPRRPLLPAALYIGFHLIEGEALTPMLLARRFTLNPVLVSSRSSSGSGCGAFPVRSSRCLCWPSPRSSAIVFARSPQLVTFSRGETSPSGSSLICVIRLVRWRTERCERADVTPHVLMDGTHQ